MEGIYQWVCSIVTYFILVTMAVSLLPSGKYEKYLRLFAGCVLILLVLQPLTGSLGLEERINALFSSFSTQNELEELRGKLGEAEKQRLKQVLDAYEAAAEEEILRLAGEAGFKACEASVALQRDEDSPQFGQVTAIRLELKSDREGKMGQEGQEEIAVQAVERIAISEAAEASAQKQNAEAGDAEAGDAEAGNAEAGDAEAGDAEAGETQALRRQLAGYYGVEEEHVEIRLENE